MEQWSSRFGFMLAAIGAAVGIGNIWRFSAVVGQNGGGAYLLPYFIAAFAFGVPLMILELSVGRNLRADVVTAFKRVRREYEIVGWLISAIVLLILSYYLVITGWILAFLVFTAASVDTTFSAFTASLQPLAFFVVSTVTVGVVVSLGVKDGIERLAKFLIPLVFVILAGLVVYVTTLPGFRSGVTFFLQPDFSVLSDPFVWSAAFGQVFFSLSVGQGIMLTYGSYLDDETDVARSALTITVADLAVAMMAGLVIFPIVFTFGMEPTMGTELAFSTLPMAFASMPFGTLVGVAFFGLLFVAAITPSVSMMEVGVAAITRTTTLSRRRASAVVTVAILLVGSLSALSYSAVDLHVFGVRFLDLLDETVGTLGLPISALVIAVAFTWLQDADVVREQLGDSVVLPLTKYVVPVVLLAVTALRLAFDLNVPAWRRLPGLSALGAGTQVVGTLLVVAVALAVGWAFVRFRATGRSAPTDSESVR